MRADPSERLLGPWLDAFLAEAVGPVERLRVRVKPGTSAALALRGTTGERPLLLALAYDAAGAPKLAKTARRARGDLVALDERAGVVVVRARADRDLPGVRALRGEVDVLSYNPQRRLVARVRPGDDGAGDEAADRLVRVVRPAAHAATTRGVRALGGYAGTPRLLDEHAEAGTAVLTWAPGRVLDGASAARDLRTAGAAVARLHAAPVALPPLTGVTAAPRKTARLLAHLLPDERTRLVGLAGAVERGLRALEERSAGATRPLHGDLSRDQVVVDDAGRPALLDLDRAGAGDPAYDLASLLADDRAHGWAGAEALLEGYAEVAPLPAAEALAAHTAAHLLRRAAEPFRTCRPDWRAECLALVAAVEEQCGERAGRWGR